MKKRERFDIDGIAYELVVNLHDMQEGEDDVYGITDSRHKYVLVTNENKYLGGVLYINSDLRDGIAMLVVDDCGHTSFIDSKTKVSDVINTKADNKNVFIAVHSESYTQVMRISREFERDSFGMAFEIHKLRTKIKELTNE